MWVCAHACTHTEGMSTGVNQAPRQYSLGGSCRFDTILCVYWCMLNICQTGGRAVHNVPVFEGDGYLSGESGIIQISAKMLAILDFNVLYVMNTCINQALAIYFLSKIRAGLATRGMTDALY